MAEPWRKPFASSEAVARKMSRLARKDTGPELALRRELHGRGLRYFVHRRPLPGLRREADIVFPRVKVAVFVDGCFWHGCSEHGNRRYRTNAWYWPEKIQRNRERDRDTDKQLRRAGWTPVRIWEHVPAPEGARTVEQALDRRQLTAGSDVISHAKNRPSRCTG